MKKRIVSTLLALIILATPASSLAHGGNTDRSGGHRDNKNKSGLGSYHYHCGGYGPHLHNNGACPYKSNYSKSKSSSKKAASSKKVKSASSQSSNKAMNIKIQTKLNNLGYNCGKADGSIGKNTIGAIKKFQKAKGLSVDGSAGPQTRRALGL